MKKFIGLLLLFIVSVAISNVTQAQTKLKPYEYAYVYLGKTADTATVNQTNIYKDVFVNKPSSLYYNVSIKLTTANAGKCSASLQGKIFTDDDYTNITTYNYAGSQSDTTLIFTQNSTKQFYRYYRIKVTYSSGKCSIYNIKYYFKNL